MARIFSNKTTEEIAVQCDNVTQLIPGSTQVDLTTVFTLPQLSACDGLVELLGQGIDKYQLSDGSNDLSVTQAISLIRGCFPVSLNIKTDKASADGSPVITTKKIESSKLTFNTPNWCNKCTWYEESAYVEDEIATDDGSHTIYSVTHQFLIDTYHGRITFEDFLLDSSNRSFRVVVKVNDVPKTEQDPHFGIGNDYIVNYEDGKITFLTPLLTTDVVKASYHYATSSLYTLKPTENKILLINKVEVQFADDVEMRDSFVFQAYGFVEKFAPSLSPNPYPAGTLIPLGDPLIYKCVDDIENDSNKAYPAYPAIGGTGWRAKQYSSYTYSWDYDVGSTYLRYSDGAELRLKLAHDTVCGGSKITVTFYCTSEVEG